MRGWPQSEAACGAPAGRALRHVTVLYCVTRAHLRDDARSAGREEYGARALLAPGMRGVGVVSCMVPRFGRFAAAAVVMAMKSSAAAGSRLTTDGRSVLIKRPELLTTAVASEGSRFEAIVAPASWNTGSVLDHVNSDQFVPFLRALIATAEEDFGLSNYHLRFCAHSQYDRAPARGHKLGLAKLEGECLAAAERSGCYVVLAGDRLPAREVPRAPSLEALDCPIEYTDDSGKVVSNPTFNPNPDPNPNPNLNPDPTPTRRSRCPSASGTSWCARASTATSSSTRSRGPCTWACSRSASCAARYGSTHCDPTRTIKYRPTLATAKQGVARR